MILVEGPRNVGKTFLIESTKLKSFKISFVEDFLKRFPEDPCEKREIFNFGYAVGKDISLMKANQAGLIPVDTIVDRSFITTCVYSRIFRRVPEELIQRHFDNMVNDFSIQNKSISLIIVLGQNTVSRVKDDFDFVDYKKELEAYNYYIQQLPYSYIIINRFDQDSILEFHDIIKDSIRRMKSENY